MTTSAHTRLLTADEFLTRYAADEPYELLEGELITVPPPKWTHGEIASQLLSYLAPFVRIHKLGRTAGEVGFKLSEHTILAPDVAFISNVRFNTVAKSDEYFPFAPDLAVEIVSPGKSANEIALKIQLYLAAGASLVWVIYPLLRKVVVHHADRTANDVSIGEMLTGGDLLPGLSIPVADLFSSNE